MTSQQRPKPVPPCVQRPVRRVDERSGHQRRQREEDSGEETEAGGEEE